MSVSLQTIHYRLLVFLTLTAPVIAVYSGKALTPIIAAIALLPTLWICRKSTAIILPTQLSYVVTAFFVYALTSTLWASEAADAALLWCRVVLLLSVIIALCASTQHLTTTQNNTILFLLFIGSLFTIANFQIALYYDNFIYRWIKSGDYRLFEYSYTNRATSFLVLLYWPIIAWLLSQKRKSLALVIIYTAIILFTLSMLSSTASPIALLFGLVVALIAYLPSYCWKRPFQIIAVIITLSVPVIFTYSNSTTMNNLIPEISPSAYQHHRLKIWEFAANKATENPILGWGFNGSRHIPVKEDEMITDLSSPAHPLPLHPHNFILQIWLELGAIGVAMFAMILYLTIGWIAEHLKKRKQHAIAMGMFTSYMFFGQVSYGIWQNWWLAALGLALFYLKLSFEFEKNSS